MSDIKTIVVLQDVEVTGTLYGGEIVQATEALGDTWRLTKPERFKGFHLANRYEAEESFTLQEVAAFLSEQWGKAVPKERVFEWRVAGKFPNAVAVPAHGHAGRRWYVPRSDLEAFVASHTYTARTPV